jgi:hypothetical protein
VLEKVGDPQLRVYVVWLPIQPQAKMGLGGSAAQRESTRVADPRAAHFYDSDAWLGRVFRETIGLPEGSPAWDVFFVFDRDARWGEQPPEPAFWMHQLSARWWGDRETEEIRQRRLDGDELRRKVEEILRPRTSSAPSRLDADGPRVAVGVGHDYVAPAVRLVHRGLQYRAAVLPRARLHRLGLHA